VNMRPRSWQSLSRLRFQFRNVLHEKREADGYIQGNSDVIIYYIFAETSIRILILVTKHDLLTNINLFKKFIFNIF